MGLLPHVEINHTADRDDRDDNGDDRPEVKLRAGHADFVTALRALASSVIERFRTCLEAAVITFELFPLATHGAFAGSFILGEVAVAFATFINWSILQVSRQNCLRLGSIT